MNTFFAFDGLLGLLYVSLDENSEAVYVSEAQVLLKKHLQRSVNKKKAYVRTL